MVLPRAYSVRNAFGRSILRNYRPRVKSRFNQQLGRRAYASEHGSHKSGSDIPWMIGSVAVTIPSAAWLWQQGPQAGGDHGHGAHEEHKTEEEPKEEPKDEAEDAEKPKDEGGDADEKDKKDEEAEDSKKEENGDDKAKSKDKKEKSEDSGSDDKDTPTTSDDDSEGDKSGEKDEGKTEKKEKKKD